MALLTILGVLVAWFGLFLIILRAYIRVTLGMCYSRTDLKGMTVIVTGANTGIGFETARDLYRRRARVIMACRDMTRGEVAAKEIRAGTGSGQLVVKRLDLSSFQSIREFAEEVSRTEDRLDVLVNSAGMSAVVRELTVDGNEMIVGTNHLGPFLLTNLLLDLLKKSSPSRIVNVSSAAHKYAKLDPSDLNQTKYFHAGMAYFNSKLANILFTKELSEKLKGTGVTVNSLHPGLVKTEILRNVHGFVGHFFRLLFWAYGKSAFEGAQTSIYLSVSDEVEGVTGKYFADCKETSTGCRAAEDIVLARELWEESTRITGLNVEKY